MPVRMVCPDCGASQVLDDEYAGKKARCSCGSVVLVGSKQASYEVGAPPAPPHPQPNTTVILVLAGLGAAALLLGGVLLFARARHLASRAPVATKADTPEQPKAPRALTPTQLYWQVVRSVVVIKTAEGTGSGFVVEPGIVVTNFHVIRGASRATLRAIDRRSAVVDRVLGSSPAKDIAFLPLPPALSGMPRLSLATEIADVGVKVYAIGAPQGMEFTLTSGLISQYRDFPGLGRVLQTDASLSPGSSGCPLVDGAGRVLAMVTVRRREANDLNMGVVARTIAAQKRVVLQGVAEALVKKARAWFIDGKPGKAEDALDRALAYAPWHAGARTMLSKIRLLAEQPTVPVLRPARPGTETPEPSGSAAADGLARAARKARTELLGSEGTDDPALLAQLREAEKLLKAGEYVAAHAALERVSKAYRCRLADHYASLAEVLYKAGKMRLTLDACDRALAAWPDHPAARYHRGLAHVKLGLPDMALDDFDAAIRLAPDVASYRYSRGLMRAKQGRLNIAADDLDAAVRLDASMWQAWYQLGQARKKLRQNALASRAFRAALPLAPEQYRPAIQALIDQAER